MFSPEEQKRYNRQLILPEFGEMGQQALKAASVLVIGAGGLGCPVLTYLAAAGVGRIGIVDGDIIEESNLHRQVLFNFDDVGLYKAEVAAQKIALQNPHIEVEHFSVRLSADNAMDIISNFNIVVDGSDNFPTRYLVNDAGVLLDKTIIYGAIHQYEGQVSVFNYLQEDGSRGPNYRDLFPQPPLPDQVPNCSEAGVLGVLPGIIGCLQANETIKVILNHADMLSGKLLLFDARATSTMKINIKKTAANPLTGENPTITELIDYETFCGISKTNVPEISRTTLQQWKNNNKEIVLIDVRELEETQAQPYEAQHLPMSEFHQRMHEVPENRVIVFVCRSGNRSVQAIEILKENNRVGEWYSLKGGIL